MAEKMTMKKALAIGFGGFNAANKAELLAAAAKLRTTRSATDKPVNAGRAELMEKMAAAMPDAAVMTDGDWIELGWL